MFNNTSSQSTNRSTNNQDINQNATSSSNIHSNDLMSNWTESLSDISVGEILDVYKNDTDLLKHILAAKTEEDKVKLFFFSLGCTKQKGFNHDINREEVQKKSEGLKKQDYTLNSLIYSLTRTNGHLLF